MATWKDFTNSRLTQSDWSLIIANLVPVAGVLALLYAYMRTRWVSRQDQGTDLMIEISGNNSANTCSPSYRVR